MIYADTNGHLPLDPRVQEFLVDRFQTGPMANPNASHRPGRLVKKLITQARAQCAQVLNADVSQIIFNSGASESISHVYHWVLQRKLLGQSKASIIVTSAIEHAATLNASKFLQKLGYTLWYAPVLNNGQFDLVELESFLQKNCTNIALVSLIACHNETGVIQPYQKIAQLCRRFEITCFADTTQLVGKGNFDFADSQLDFACLSSHKIGGLIGSGALLVREPEHFSSFIFGGGQESGLRGGTQNYLGIEAMAFALKLFAQDVEKGKIQSLSTHQKAFENKLVSHFPQIKIIGQQAPRLCSTTLVGHPDFLGHVIQDRLEKEQIYVTTASACCDHKHEISQVLKAMEVPENIAQGVIRISICDEQNAPAIYTQLFNTLAQIYNVRHEKLSG